MCNVQSGSKKKSRGSSRSRRVSWTRAERSERSASKGREAQAEERKGPRRRRRKKVKKTKASWRRLFAWVSLGGRRVCLVESAADLWPPPQALPLLSPASSPPFPTSPFLAAPAASRDQDLLTLELLSHADANSRVCTYIRVCTHEARGQGGKIGKEKESRHTEGESRVQLSYACVGDPFPLPAPFASLLVFSSHSSLATPAASVSIHLLVSCLARFSSIFLPRRRRSSRNVERAFSLPPPSPLRNQNFLRSNDPWSSFDFERSHRWRSWREYLSTTTITIAKWCKNSNPNIGRTVCLRFV